MWQRSEVNGLSVYASQYHRLVKCLLQVETLGIFPEQAELPKACFIFAGKAMLICWLQRLVFECVYFLNPIDCSGSNSLVLAAPVMLCPLLCWVTLRPSIWMCNVYSESCLRKTTRHLVVHTFNSFIANKGCTCAQSLQWVLWYLNLNCLKLLVDKK